MSKTERASAVEEGKGPEEKRKRAGLTCGKTSRSSRALISGNDEEKEEESSRETACSRLVHAQGRRGRQTQDEVEICQSGLVVSCWVETAVFTK